MSRRKTLPSDNGRHMRLAPVACRRKPFLFAGGTSKFVSELFERTNLLLRPPARSFVRSLPRLFVGPQSECALSEFSIIFLRCTQALSLALVVAQTKARTQTHTRRPCASVKRGLLSSAARGLPLSALFSNGRAVDSSLSRLQHARRARTHKQSVRHTAHTHTHTHAGSLTPLGSVC